MEGAEHRIHVWRVADGHLEVTLDGPKEGIKAILWHPLRPVIASLGASFGGVYVWEKNFTENWSAFAAEFSELEANEEYVEAEDEFDLRDPEDDEKRKEAREKEEAGFVDIETCDCAGWFSSASEESDSFFYVPAEPKPQSPSQMQELSEEFITDKICLAVENRDDRGAVPVPGSQRHDREMSDGGSGSRRRRGRSADGKVSKPKRVKVGTKRRGSDMNTVDIGSRVVPATNERPPKMPVHAEDGVPNESERNVRKGGLSSRGNDAQPSMTNPGIIPTFKSLQSRAGQKASGGGDLEDLNVSGSQTVN